jgi:hypothetical protein
MHKCVNNTIGNVYHLEQMVDNFFPYSQKQLSFDKGATIVFQSDEDNAGRMLGKTAYYDPENFQIVLYTDGRHPKDILRSLSHELVHHAQNCRGDFTRDNPTYAGYAQKDPHLRDMEREAYEKGNLIFRDFEDLIKTGKINVEIDFSQTGEPKMSLKEWKNNEINTKLMKKWGLLKEGAKPDFLDLDKDGDKEEPMKDAAKDAKEKDLDEANCGRTEDEIEEGVFGLKSADEKRRELADRPDFSPGGPRAGDPGLDPPTADALERDKYSKMPATKRPRLRVRASDLAGRGRGMSIKGITSEDVAPKMISVHEAKQITRRILERVRKESK